MNPEEERLARWTTCQLSGMPLQLPCVADELGSLFNKDAVLQVREGAFSLFAFLLGRQDAVLLVRGAALFPCLLGRQVRGSHLFACVGGR